MSEEKQNGANKKSMYENGEIFQTNFSLTLLIPGAANWQL